VRVVEEEEEKKERNVGYTLVTVALVNAFEAVVVVV
jgi:hypothetical protein